MIPILSTLAGKSANPVCWQCHSSLLSDWLILVGIATAAIWLMLSLICLVMERRTIGQVVPHTAAGQRWSPTKVFSLLFGVCANRSVKLSD